MDCCKRKISEVLAARELYSLNCSLLAKQFFFAVAIWPVTGQGVQNTKWPAVLYYQSYHYV